MNDPTFLPSTTTHQLSWNLVQRPKKAKRPTAFALCAQTTSCSLLCSFAWVSLRLRACFVTEPAAHRPHSDFIVSKEANQTGHHSERNSESLEKKNDENGTCSPTASYFAAHCPELAGLFTLSTWRQQRRSFWPQVCFFTLNL